MPGGDIARQFRLFGVAIRDEVPLYTRLAEAIAEDNDLLDLAARALPGQPAPNVLFGAVHFLVLGGTDHPLASWYDDANRTGDPYPDFRSFCLAYRPRLEVLVESRRTQTNEVARCVGLLPAFAHVMQRVPSQNLGLIEIGASAGLLLNFDRYYYDYDGRGSWGDQGSPVRLRTRLVGEVPPLPVAPVPIVSRVGIDLHPLDATDEADGRWLQALLWPGQGERRDRLQRALRIAEAHPPLLLKGDALERIRALIAGVSADAVPVVYHSFALIQWTSAQRSRLDELLRAADRPLIRVWLEWFDVESDLPEVRIMEYRDGRASSDTVARFHHHGLWLDWRSATG